MIHAKLEKKVQRKLHDDKTDINALEKDLLFQKSD